MATKTKPAKSAGGAAYRRANALKQISLAVSAGEWELISDAAHASRGETMVSLSRFCRQAAISAAKKILEK